MDLKALLAGMVGTLESLTPFVRDDGANYHAELKNNLSAAMGVAEEAGKVVEAVAPATANTVEPVLAAIEALGSHLADLTAIVHDVRAAMAYAPANLSALGSQIADLKAAVTAAPVQPAQPAQGA
jgi:hypothetical protein